MRSRTRPGPAILLLLVLTATAPALQAEEIPARLAWADRLELGTPLSGTITRVLVNPGDRVRRGQPLIEMDTRALQAEEQQAGAQEHRLRLARDEARREHDRTREMYDRTLIAERELALAEIARRMAEAEHQAAQAALTRVRLDLEHARVIARHVAPGQVIHNALRVQPLLTLAADGPMLAVADVEAAVLDRLSPGTKVEVRVGDRRLAGRVQGLGLEPVDESLPRFRLEVVFSPPEALGLRAGLTAVVVLP
ncbi:efflux RND transporter periplasmic adaptor subunit [Ectothiorhodospira shaposhnikovii]|uniref:efflux RND transporter periplasmic adaptor subunit n=1 Tax=Ectothiorhodospira shaposhnikovii TaxID=1054 RepID=UPI0039A0CCB8